MGCGASSAISKEDENKGGDTQFINTKMSRPLIEREDDLNEMMKKKGNLKSKGKNRDDNTNVNDNISKKERRNKRKSHFGTLIFHSQNKRNLSKKEENDLDELDNLLLENDNDKEINNENVETPFEEKEESYEEDDDEDEEDFGVLIDETIKEMYQSDLSEDDIIVMVSNAVSQTMQNKNSPKSLNEKQITVIGTIIHNVLFSKHTFDLSRPIKHKSLKGVFVKVCIKKLSMQLIKDTFFKGNNVTKKQLKKAAKEIIGGSNIRDISVLKIEIF